MGLWMCLQRTGRINVGERGCPYRGGPTAVLKPRQDDEGLPVEERPRWDVRAWKVRVAAPGEWLRAGELNEYII